MIDITMPTPFEARFLDGIERLNAAHAPGGVRVAEFYGSLPRSEMGVGRPTRSLTPVTREALAEHVADLRGRGFHFSYLFNGSCSGNREYRREERGRLLDEMAWVRSIGARSVVVASPFVIDMWRHHFPDVRVHASTVCFTRSLKEVAHHVRQGVARVILDPDTIRDFRFLRTIRERFPDLELEALANHPCLLHCPFETYCYNSVAHASSHEGAAADQRYECFSLLRCNAEKLRDPVEFVRGSWMRPQDIHHYEDVGVQVLKLAGRGRSTEWLLATAEAYLSRHFDGNLMDLIWEAQWAAVQRSVPASPDLPPLDLHVDAAAFDGFVEQFARERTPCATGCDSCGICPSFARRGVTWNEQARRANLAALEAALDGLLAPPPVAQNGKHKTETGAEVQVAELRDEIDALDDDLFDLLARRAGRVGEIRATKADAGLPEKDADREAQILSRLGRRHANTPLARDAIAAVFDTIRDACAPTNGNSTD